MLKVKASGKSCVLASLMADKIESSVLELMFEEGEVEFSVSGPNEIHLSGNMLDNDDGDDLNMMAGDDDDDDEEEGEGSGDEDEDEDEDEGDDDSEEEAPPQKGAKKPKAADKMEEDSDGQDEDEEDEEEDDEEDEVSIAAECTFARASIYVREHATVRSCCRAMLHHAYVRVSGMGRTMVKKTRRRTKTMTTKRRRRRRKQSARNAGRQQGSKRQQAQGSSRRRQPRRRPRKARQWRRPGPAKCLPTSKPRSRRCWQGTPLVSRAQISPGSGRRCMVREGGPSRMLWPSVASRSRLR